MNDEFRKLQSDFRTYKKMTVSIANNLDRLENENPFIKKSIEGFDGRMLIMAVKIVELQERIEAIEESIHHSKSKKTQILEGGKESKLMDEKLPSSEQRVSQSLKGSVEYEESISQFLIRFEEKNKGSLVK